MENKEKELPAKQGEKLLDILKARFEKNMNRHMGIKWAEVQERLMANPQKLWSLQQMESTGGEPDVVGVDNKARAIIFIDCSLHYPKGRRSLCYDREALEARKEHKPAGSAMGMAEEMGIELLDEEHYRLLQKFGPIDSKTSSWLKTPEKIRDLGGAIVGDYRYGQVFVYQNGADSYYAARGFRAMLKV